MTPSRIAQLVRRFGAEFRSDPKAALIHAHHKCEHWLIRRDGRRSLRRANVPREPYDEIGRAIAPLRWFHRVPLPDGRVTPGVSNTPRYAARLRWPDLSGKTVLDVGAWDGYYAFEAERRGAARVLATDHFSWTGGGWGTREAFDTAHRLLASRVEALDIDIAAISPSTIGTFDVVLFLGVLYHLPDPLLALERVASVTRELLILETMVDLTFMRQPALTFQRGRSQPPSQYRHWRHDPTTWFVPNDAAVVAMLEHAGFTRIERVYPRTTFFRRLVHAANALVPLFNVQKNYRALFYAWKRTTCAR